jgi:hypothetical protein
MMMIVVRFGGDGRKGTRRLCKETSNQAGIRSGGTVQDSLVRCPIGRMVGNTREGETPVRDRATQQRKKMKASSQK